LTYYASLVTENVADFKGFSDYMVADAYFSKKPFVYEITSSGLHFISRLRDDSVLMYKYKGEPSGKKGAAKKFIGRVDPQNPDLNYFTTDVINEDIAIYSAAVYSKAFKKDIKLAITIFFKDGKEIARKLYFSTDTNQAGEKTISNYRSRFQIEFLYRDAKQFTGLSTCQARSKNKLDLHFNATLTTVTLVKHDWISTENHSTLSFSMANYKTLNNNTLMLKRFMCMFAINPYSAKNQKIVKELLYYGKIAA